MTKILIAAPLSVALAVPAYAGQPDIPGRPGDIVADSRIPKQESNPNGWGQHVASKAGPDGSLGQHLQSVDEGPNPDNDRGAGND